MKKFREEMRKNLTEAIETLEAHQGHFTEEEVMMIHEFKMILEMMCRDLSVLSQMEQTKKEELQLNCDAYQQA